MSSVRLSGNVGGTGIFTVASPNSNSNQTLTLPDSTGTVALTSDIVSGGARAELFTTTGTSTFTVPAGVTAVKVTVVAGGGGGGGPSAQSRAGGGGGGGGTAIEWVTGLTPGSTVTVTVGAGGTATAGANGGTGGTSSFGAFCSATGGAGGVGGNAFGGGGAAGTATGGNFNIPGGAGSAGIIVAQGVLSGSGGATNYAAAQRYSHTVSGCPCVTTLYTDTFGVSYFGRGGNRVDNSANSNGVAGSGYGAGGSGGNRVSGAGSQAGGAGAPGFVLVEY
jgi:hypothetical protein